MSDTFLVDQIEMDHREVSVAGVRYALDAEPPELRKHVLSVVSVVLPFIEYEASDYEFGSGHP